MTSFTHGRTRAHVMEWANTRSQWEPLCGRSGPVVMPSKWRDRHDEWPLKSVGYDPRLVPWCTQCVRSVQRQVDRLTEDVLVPAASEAVTS